MGVIDFVRSSLPTAPVVEGTSSGNLDHGFCRVCAELVRAPQEPNLDQVLSFGTSRNIAIALFADDGRRGNKASAETE